MDERDAQAVLLVRAFEEADGRGLLLSPAERSGARPPADETEAPAFLATRAHGLLDRLRGRIDGIDLVLRATRPRVPMPGLVWLLALLAGLSLDALGASRRVHLLDLPLVGLLAFNLLVYVALAAHGLSRRLRRAPAGPRRSWLVGWARRVSSWAVRARLGRNDETGAVAGDALARFLAGWGRSAAHLSASRIGLVLHVGAAALVAGAVAGMYLRGLAVEFRVTWESTLLSPGSATALLGVVLAPGRALLGTDLPALEPLRAPADGPAALWIHLYAASAAGWVLAPRAALAFVEARRAARLARSLPLDLDSAYFRRLLAPARGGGAAVRVVPYSHRLGPRARDALVSLLLDVYGGRATVEVAEPVDYGAEAEDGSPPTGGHLVTVFSLAQTPEAEVHGRFLAALRSGVDPLVVVDGASYRERLAGTPTAEARLAERRRAWDRVLRDTGLRAAHLDLGEACGPQELEALTGALGPGAP